MTRSLSKIKSIRTRKRVNSSNPELLVDQNNQYGEAASKMVINDKSNMDMLESDIKALFVLLKDKGSDITVNICKVIQLFTDEELLDNSDLVKFLQNLKKCSGQNKISYENFDKCVKTHPSVVLILMDKMVKQVEADKIIDDIVDNIVAEDMENTGSVRSDHQCPYVKQIFDQYAEISCQDYHPQHSSDKEHWGVSICTTNGNLQPFGDANVPFPMKSLCLPFLYGLALDTLGSERVHKYVNVDSYPTNDQVVRYDKPFNPLVTAGGIVLCSLLNKVKDKKTRSERIDEIMEFIQTKCTCGDYSKFRHSIYASEKENDLYVAIGHLLKHNKLLPAEVSDSDLTKILDLYFQVNSFEITCEAGSKMAAVLANSGKCPKTGAKLLTKKSIQSIYHVMSNCGLQSYSNNFYFQTKMPAISCCSGVIMMVVPDLFGICCYSTKLNDFGISCRGLKFCLKICKDLTKPELLSDISILSSNNTSSFRSSNSVQPDDSHESSEWIFKMVVQNNLTAVEQYFNSGKDMLVEDYMGRTLLHVAILCNYPDLVKFLLNVTGPELIRKVDFLNESSIDYARVKNNPHILDLLNKWSQSQEI